MHRFRTAIAVATVALLALGPTGLVAQPARVTVAPANPVIAVDGSIQLQAAAFDAEGRQLSAERIVWVSPGENVRVDQSGLVTGLIPGRTVVAAVVEGVAGVANVTVSQVPPDELLVVDALEVPVGAGRVLEIVGRTRFEELVDVPDVMIESSAPNVAMVDDVRRVLGVSPGSATLRLSAGEATASVTVRVVPNAAVAYELTPGGADVLTGDVVRLSVTGRTSDGGAVTGFEPRWSISGTGAIIGPDGEEGVFVAEEPGTYIVTAAIGPDASESIVIRAEPRTNTARLIKVGRGAASTHRSGDTWVFEGVDGRD